MFEKCGLRDVFVRIGKLKWLILILVIIGAAAGSLMYAKDLSAYQAEMKKAETGDGNEMYLGRAFYYINATVKGADSYAKMQSAAADTLKKTMSLNSTSYEIYKEMLKDHTEEELRSLLDEEFYADRAVSKYKLYGRSYGVRTTANKTVIELRVCAETREMCSELLNICRVKLKEMDKTMTHIALKFENKFIRKGYADQKYFSDIYVPKTDANGNVIEPAEEEDSEETVPSAPGMGSIALGAVIGLLAGIIIAIAAAVFVPTINRDSDFEGYGVPSFGTVRKNGAAVFARILAKKAKEKGAGSISLVTTVKENKKMRAFFEELSREAEGIGPDLTFIIQPAKIAESSDACESAEMIVALEKKGISRHQRFDEMKHYLELLEKGLDGAVLLA